MKKGDLVVPWGNRVTSNAVRIGNIKLARIVETPKKLNCYDPKEAMVIEIIEGHASSSREGRSKSRFGNLQMHNNWHTTSHGVGTKLIVFADGFKSDGSSIHETTTSEGTSPSLNLEIKSDTLMCLLA